MKINLFKHAGGIPDAPGQAGNRPRRSRRALIAGIALAAAAAASVGGADLAGASASVSPAAVQTEHFQMESTSGTANTAPVIAYGAFTAGGTDIMGNTADTFKFSNGTFKIAHSQGQGSQSFNPNTCLLTLNLHGTYTLGHGTGRYAGIRGHGTYQLSILAIGGRSKGKCNQNAAPVAFQQTIKASGPVHL